MCLIISQMSLFHIRIKWAREGVTLKDQWLCIPADSLRLFFLSFVTQLLLRNQMEIRKIKVKSELKLKCSGQWHVASDAPFLCVKNHKMIIRASWGYSMKWDRDTELWGVISFHSTRKEILEMQYIAANYTRLDYNAVEQIDFGMFNSCGRFCFHWEIFQSHALNLTITLTAVLQIKSCTYKTVRGDTIVVLQSDIFLSLPILTLDLHHSTEALRPRDAIFSIGAYQLPRPFSKVAPTLSHLTCELQRTGIFNHRSQM